MLRKEYSMNAEFIAANFEANATIVRNLFKIFPNQNDDRWA